MFFIRLLLGWFGTVSIESLRMVFFNLWSCLVLFQIGLKVSFSGLWDVGFLEFPRTSRDCVALLVFVTQTDKAFALRRFFSHEPYKDILL